VRKLAVNVRFCGARTASIIVTVCGIELAGSILMTPV
jgi:hypothetical protein